jgi:hypothetical protein
MNSVFVFSCHLYKNSYLEKFFETSILYVANIGSNDIVIGLWVYNIFSTDIFKNVSKQILTWVGFDPMIIFQGAHHTNTWTKLSFIVGL